MGLKSVTLTLTVLALGPFFSNVDPNRKFAWCENVGWTNWQHDSPGIGQGVTVTPTHLAGLTWGENVGWINVGNGGGPYANDPADGSTFGVNIDPATGGTYGKAWGENIGWLNFDTSASLGPHGQQARFDACYNRFRGYIWGENVGWVNLEDATHSVALGPACEIGDVACDGIVALPDYAWFSGVFMGPDVPVACPLFDDDGDGDIDILDFSAFQTGFTGGE